MISWAHRSLQFPPSKKILQIIKGHTEEAMLALHRKHGDFVRIAPDEIGVSHPDAVKQLLHAKIPKGSWYEVFSVPDYRSVSQKSETDAQRHIEKGKNKSEDYVDDIIAALKGQLHRLAVGAQSTGKTGEMQAHLDKWFNFFAFDVVGEVTFSRSFGFVQAGSDIGNAITNARKLALYVSIVGQYVWIHHLSIDNPWMSRLGLIPASHLFDTCLAAIDVRNNHLDRMAEEEVFAAAAANGGAGAETVSASLQALVYHLLKDPVCLRRLQAELDRAQGKGKLSTVVKYSEAMGLPYLQACIKEAYRYHPSIGTNLPRVVPKGGMTIRGRYFEEGRWLDKERAAKMDYRLVHWGAGYNQCPGRNLAHFEISKLAATLLRDYEFERADPEKEWEFKNHFITTPCNWPCWVRRRTAV
ncbi:cytochrome P450 [Aspergillus similis]